MIAVAWCSSRRLRVEEAALRRWGGRPGAASGAGAASGRRAMAPLLETKTRGPAACGGNCKARPEPARCSRRAARRDASSGGATRCGETSRGGGGGGGRGRGERRETERGTRRERPRPG
ncbi:unnamed protein product [Lampetra fluviatilis]